MAITCEVGSVAPNGRTATIRTDTSSGTYVVRDARTKSYRRSAMAAGYGEQDDEAAPVVACELDDEGANGGESRERGDCRNAGGRHGCPPWSPFTMV